MSTISNYQLDLCPIHFTEMAEEVGDLYWEVSNNSEDSWHEFINTNEKVPGMVNDYWKSLSIEDRKKRVLKKIEELKSEISFLEDYLRL